MINSYYLQSLIYQSLCSELNCYPKPGLVTPYSNGCHKDMDYKLMMKSIYSIYDQFYPFIEIGINNQLDNCLCIARPLAINLENRMLAATNNVNTHKGVIYLYAITCISLGYAITHKQSFSQMITNYSIINKDDYKALIHNDNPLSYGQKIYKQYQLDGIIGEVYRNLETITDYSLPLLDSKHSFIECLLTIIVHSQDSCILHHNDINTYYYIKNQASYLLSLINKDINLFNEQYFKFCLYCNNNHISAGGSADLLSLTIFLQQIKNNLDSFQ